MKIFHSSQLFVVTRFFCAYHLYIPMVNLFHPWKLCHPSTLSMQKKTPNFRHTPTYLTPPTSSLPKCLSPKKKQKNLLHLLCAHSTSHRTKAIPSLATALAPGANGGAIQGTVGRPTARQPIRGHREHRRVQPATQQEVRGNARLAGRWAPMGYRRACSLNGVKYITPTNGRKYHG